MATTANQNAQPWGRGDIPPQEGALAVVTGSTGGIGYETALALAAAGAEVIIAARNPDKAQAAMREITRHVPHASLRFELLDLASLDSVHEFARRLIDRKRSLDLLVNNAAVMTPPERLVTRDGFELQFGTNYLGHFALTGLLLPILRPAVRPRVVTLSSIAARNATINFDDLQSEHGYKPMAAYAQSKLACLMFALELQSRSKTSGWGVTSIAAHPGIARTNLIHNGAGPRSLAGTARSLLWFLFQPSAQGALPGLYAATSPNARGGGYYGPARLAETRGHPAEAIIPKQALDPAATTRLWTTSQALSGVSIPNH